MKPASDCRAQEREVRAFRAASPPKIDGRLDESIWQDAQQYQLVRALDHIEQRPEYTTQPGSVQLAWDDEHLYVAGRFTDDDIIAQSERDNQMQFQFGDTLELFLKPSDQTHYWELHAAPNGKQATLRIAAAGLIGLSGHKQDLDPTTSVAAMVDGTINDDSNHDVGWTVELAIPMAQLTGHEFPKLEPNQRWHVLAARYNYGRYLVHRSAELTMFPQLSRSSFHDVWEFATLVLDP